MNPETITRHTYDRIASAYSRETCQSRVRQGIRPYLLNFARQTGSGAQVLVAGAGDGRDAVTLRARGIVPLHVDYSHAMNTIARRRDRDAVSVTADVQALPFAAESFDAV
jgi:ubiquinone/menaquinone biosynthesis C-methylase UbiE